MKIAETLILSAFPLHRKERETGLELYFVPKSPENQGGMHTVYRVSTTLLDYESIVQLYFIAMYSIE